MVSATWRFQIVGFCGIMVYTGLWDVRRFCEDFGFSYWRWSFLAVLFERVRGSEDVALGLGVLATLKRLHDITVLRLTVF